MAAVTTKLTISSHHTLVSADGPHQGRWICCYSNSWAEELKAVVTESGGECVLDEFGSVLCALADSGSEDVDVAVAAAVAGCAPPGSGCPWWQTPGIGSTASPLGSRHKPCPANARQT